MESRRDPSIIWHNKLNTTSCYSIVFHENKHIFSTKLTCTVTNNTSCGITTSLKRLNFCSVSCSMGNTWQHIVYITVACFKFCAAALMLDQLAKIQSTQLLTTTTQMLHHVTVLVFTNEYYTNIVSTKYRQYANISNQLLNSMLYIYILSFNFNSWMICNFNHSTS